MTMSFRFKAALFLGALLSQTESLVAFQPVALQQRHVYQSNYNHLNHVQTLRLSTLHASSTSGDSQSQDTSSSSDAPTAVTVERVLQDNYPDFYKLLKKNDNIFNQLNEGYDGYTMFVPNAQAFMDLSEKQRKQLEDPRNLETAQKMGLYHIVGEALDITQLNREDWTVPKVDGLPALKFRALATLGGEVPLGRTKKTTEGSVLRQIFKGPSSKVVKDDEGNPVTQLVVGPAASLKRSVKIGKAMIHEVDALVSPTILWRYCDQLRIPGF